MIANKKYNIVYADPPWQYNESWGNGQVGYDTMTVSYTHLTLPTTPNV